MGYDCLNLVGEQPLGISDSSSELSPDGLMTQINTNGIKTLTTSDMHTRTQEENKKYFVAGVFGFAGDPNALPYDFSLKMKSPVHVWAAPIVLTPGDNIDVRSHSFLTPSVIYLPGRSKYSKINTLHINDSQIFNEDIKEEYKRVLLQIIRTNKAKASAGTADVSITLPTISSVIWETEDETVKISSNMLKVKDILSSNNCVVSDPAEDLVTVKNHNEMIKSTKDKVNFIEKEFFLEFEDDITLQYPSDIRLVIAGEDYNENGQFIFKDPLFKFIKSSNPLMEVSLMKSTLPSKVGNNKERIERYNLAEKTSPLYKSALAISAYTSEAALEASLKILPNQIKSLIHAATGQIPSVNPSLQIARAPWQDIDLDIADPLNDLGIYAYYYFNYKTIFKVEVLTGYSNNGDVVSPSWLALTSDLLEELHSQKDNVFCRIVPWTNDFFNVIPPALEDPLYMPVYDQYFVISSINPPAGG
jgi:hypothetical protein